MRNTKIYLPIVFILVIFMIIAGRMRSKEIELLAADPVNAAPTLADQPGLTFDPDVSSDGAGSIRIKADGPQTYTIREVGDVDAEDATITYTAMLKTENLEGKAYIEMLCAFPGKGTFFSRALDSAMSGTTDWTAVSAPFFLKKGENPDKVTLNLVVDGKGTVWIDDIKLEKSPLE